MMSRIVTRLVLPAAVPVITQQVDLNCKPSELPIYTRDAPKDLVKPRREPGAVEQQIGNVRRQVVSLTKYVDTTRNQVETLYDQAYDQVQWLVNYLGDEDNTTPKAGAIAVGGLTGFILALRGGFFRKIIFTSAGALGMAAVCYPKEAAEYSGLLRDEAKRYILIGYNFYHGVKKDDPPLELPSLPKIPRSFSEVWDLTKSSTTKSDNIVLGDAEKSAEVDIIGLASEEVQIDVDPVAIVTQVHSGAMHDNCHCPVGTCLNPKDESPNSNQTPKDATSKSQTDQSEIPFCDDVTT